MFTSLLVYCPHEDSNNKTIVKITTYIVSQTPSFLQTDDDRPMLSYDRKIFAVIYKLKWINKIFVSVYYNESSIFKLFPWLASNSILSYNSSQIKRDQVPTSGLPILLLTMAPSPSSVSTLGTHCVTVFEVIIVWCGYLWSHSAIHKNKNYILFTHCI